ncbi:MAG: glycosyltransferase [Acidobacteriota bacterium]
MRIVQAVGWYLPDSLGGTELYVAALAARLRELGHEVVIAAPDAAHLGERQYRHDGFDVYRYAIPAEATRAEARGTALVRGAERFHAWLAATRPDVVHFHTFVTGLGVREVEAARAVARRVLATTHASSLGFVCERGTLLRFGRALCDGVAEPVKCGACALEHRGIPRLAAEGLARVPAAVSRRAAALPGRAATAVGMRALIEGNRELQRRLFAALDAFVVLTAWARGVLIANGAPAAKVIVNRLGVLHRPGGWPRPERAPGAGRDRPVEVGLVARAEAIKGIEDAVRAVASLPLDTRLRLTVVAAARGPTERRLVEGCRALAAGDDRISFHDAVTPSAMPAVLGGFDLLLCPSRAVEGGPTVALEAHAVGTPVVASDLPAMNEFIEPGVNGDLHPPGEVPALARVLARVAADPSALDRWRAALAPPRTSHDVADDYLAIYAPPT